MSELVVATPRGLHCAAGDFYIDPWQPVERAVITHAHGDHLRAGSGSYFLAAPGEQIARLRLPADASLRTAQYGEPLQMGSVRLSFHPAGHILGSAQLRIEHAGEVWVVSGDYKRDPDPTCAPFEVVTCDVLISEATFALPIYRWSDSGSIAQEIHRWWQSNRERGVSSLLFAYALGKAQRVLAELTAFTTDSVYLHGAVASITDIYRAAGVKMLPTQTATVARAREYAGSLVIAPPSAAGSPWVRRFGHTQQRILLRLDAGARGPPASRVRSRLRALRSCGLAFTPAHVPRDRSEADSADPWPHRHDGSLPSGSEHRCRGATHRVRRGRVMQRFAELFEALDTTTSTNAKVEAMVSYLRSADPNDAAWATYVLIGRRPKRSVGPALLRRWLTEEAGLPDWLVEDSYASVGDLAETIALLVPARRSAGRGGLCREPDGMVRAAHYAAARAR